MPSKYEKLDALIVAELKKGLLETKRIRESEIVQDELAMFKNLEWRRDQLLRNRMQFMKRAGVIECVCAWRLLDA